MNLSCPIPMEKYPHILLGHGGGGKLMNHLIEDMFKHAFQNPYLELGHDSALIQANNHPMSVTTDSFVARPIIFPGGDIGKLAVYGTVNDLAMIGSRPHFLTASFILEEGLPMEVLWNIVLSIRSTAAECEVQIVTGDTKVVEKGHGDGIYINTTGIGYLANTKPCIPTNIEVGDMILLSGDIGRHGMSLMAQREQFDFDRPIESDCANLYPLVKALLDQNIHIKCMRDLTRGGTTSALVELSQQTGKKFIIEQNQIIVEENVSSACELLGIDPLQVACEGRMILFVPPQDAHKSLNILRQFDLSKNATLLGQVASNMERGRVSIKNELNIERNLIMPSGELLPRIC